MTQPGTITGQQAIDLVAKTLCGDQRHLRLERRNGKPCSSHQNEAYHVVAALWPHLRIADDEPSTVPG